MSIVNNIITPIIQAVVYVGLIGGLIIWILYIIYWVLRGINPYFKFWVKYKVFRRKWDEEAVKWCVDAIENKNMKIKDIEKFLLIKGINQKKVKEIKYTFINVEKNLKGGATNEQLRQSNEQNKIPEI